VQGNPLPDRSSKTQGGQEAEGDPFPGSVGRTRSQERERAWETRPFEFREKTSIGNQFQSGFEMNRFLMADLLSMSGGLGAEPEVDLADPQILR
jgi:hypothetical protein